MPTALIADDEKAPRAQLAIALIEVWPALRVVDVSGAEKGDAEVLIRTPLKERVAQLDAVQFWQIHRSIIVNHRQIASAARVDEGRPVPSLRGRSEKLPVSRHFQGLFRAQ